MELVFIIVGVLVVIQVIVKSIKSFSAGKKEKKEEIKKLDQKISLYNVDNIGRPYEVLSSINAKGWNQEEAKFNLQKTAYDLGADAIVSYTENIATHNHISSSRGGLMGMGDVKSVSGGSSNEFHVQGTAVKYTTADVAKNTKNIGKIMTYNSANGEGMIMLSNGEKISFNINMWEDPEELPEVGMKELNVYNDNGKVKIMTKSYQLDSLENNS